MKFGLAYEVQGPAADHHALIEETIEQCVYADEMGWDFVWFVEHHFLTDFSLSPCPEVMFGALSRLTKRIRLGFGVVILPYHHPVRVAERIAMLDHLSNGRIEFGTGRSSAFEQTGMGIDPRDTRDMWEESLTMVPKIWEADTFEWDGKFWKVPPRQVLPKPYQQPHPPIWVAALQPSTYELAAQKGIGVMAQAVSAPGALEPYIRKYKENVVKADPVGKFITNQWLSAGIGYCDENDREARDLCERSLKTFFGPGKPYVQNQQDVYQRLLDSWGGIPDHLKSNFNRLLRLEQDNETGEKRELLDLSGEEAIAKQVWNELDADTLVERGVMVAGDPESCIKAARMHEETGVDQIQFLMATDTIPHEKMMKSIEMFGKHVIPEFKADKAAKSGGRTESIRR